MQPFLHDRYRLYWDNYSDGGIERYEAICLHLDGVQPVPVSRGDAKLVDIERLEEHAVEIVARVFGGDRWLDGLDDVSISPKLDFEARWCIVFAFLGKSFGS